MKYSITFSDIVSLASFAMAAWALWRSRDVDKLAAYQLQLENDATQKTEIRVRLNEHPTAKYVLMMEFRNIGRSPARDVNIQILDDMPESQQPLTSLMDPLPIAVIPPSASSSVRMTALVGGQYRFMAKITWRNADGSHGFCEQVVSPH